MVARTGSDRVGGVGGWLRYGLPGLLAGLALAWGLEGRGPTALAQGPGGPRPVASPNYPADRPAAGATVGAETPGTGTIAMAVPAGGNSQFLYLIDTRSKALAIYRVDPSNAKGTVKLEAARQYQWDLKLAEYNCSPPEVAAIEATVRSLGQQPSR